MGTSWASNICWWMNTGDGFCKLCCWLHPLLSPQDYKGTHGQKASVTSVQTLASRTTKWAGKFIPSVSYQPGTDSWKPQQRQGTIGWNFRSFKPLPRKSSLKICSWTVAKTRIFFRLFSLQNLLWALWAHYSRWRLMVWNSNRRLGVTMYLSFLCQHKVGKSRGCRCPTHLHPLHVKGHLELALVTTVAGAARTLLHAGPFVFVCSIWTSQNKF